MSGQSKRMSLTETLLNVAIGYGIACSAQAVVFPWFGIHVPLHTNLSIGAIFTVISIVRSYALRRFFNWLHIRPPPTERKATCPPKKTTMTTTSRRS